MPEIPIIQGTVEIVGVVHGGALNCLVVPHDNPADWVFKQFVSRQELEQYAAENLYMVKENGANRS